MGTTGKRVFAATYKEASARIQGLKRGGSRFSKLGGLENRCNSTSRREVPSPLAVWKHHLLGHRRGRPLVLPACHPGTASSRSLTFAGARSPRRYLYRWVWIHTPRACSRSESHPLWRGQSLPSCRKSSSWARRWCQRASSSASLRFPATREPGPGPHGRPGPGSPRRLRAGVPPASAPSPFAPLPGAVTGEPAFGLDPGDELVHAREVRGGGAGIGCGAGGHLVFGLEARVLAAGNDEVVSDRGGPGAHEGSDALPARPEPVHQHPFGVRSAPQPPVHNGSYPATTAA